MVFDNKKEENFNTAIQEKHRTFVDMWYIKKSKFILGESWKSIKTLFLKNVVFCMVYTSYGLSVMRLQRLLCREAEGFLGLGSCWKKQVTRAGLGRFKLCCWCLSFSLCFLVLSDGNVCLHMLLWMRATCCSACLLHHDRVSPGARNTPPSMFMSGGQCTR